MPPNLELFLVAFLHGCLIAGVLLVAVAGAASVLVVGFSVGLLSVAAVDLLQLSPLALQCFESAKANLELGFVLLLCVVMDCAVGVALALKPSFERVVSEFKANAIRLRGFVDALKLT